MSRDFRNKKPKIGGLTGGIGAGKSIAAKIFQVLGIPVFNSDDEAKAAMVEDAGLRESLITLFGKEAYDSKRLNRAFLASKIFENETLRSRMNALVHPAVRQRFEDWVSRQGDVPYVLQEAAIIFETGRYREMDFMVTVSAPKELRLKRTMIRDGATKTHILSRMDAQWSDEEKILHSQFHIINDEKQALIPQILGIHRSILARN